MPNLSSWLYALREASELKPQVPHRCSVNINHRYDAQLTAPAPLLHGILLQRGPDVHLHMQGRVG